ncbi:MAG: 30S ribosomal protein S6 [Spirochaetia bacterium]|nr:30S ribosomal protein S6 [Spirochaetia bacterium]
MRKSYDCIIFLRPTLSETEMTAVINKIKNYLAEGKGEIIEEKKAEKKRLPFNIKKSREAFNLFMKFTMDSLKVNEFRERVKLIEEVNRITVANLSVTERVPEKPKKLKRQAEEAAKREAAKKAEETGKEAQPQSPASDTGAQA